MTCQGFQVRALTPPGCLSLTQPSNLASGRSKGSWGESPRLGWETGSESRGKPWAKALPALPWAPTASQGLPPSRGRTEPPNVPRPLRTSVSACPFRSPFLGLTPVSFTLFYTWVKWDTEQFIFISKSCPQTPIQFPFSPGSPCSQTMKHWKWLFTLTFSLIRRQKSSNARLHGTEPKQKTSLGFTWNLPFGARWSSRIRRYRAQDEEWAQPQSSVSIHSETRGSEWPQALLFFTQIHAMVDVFPQDAPGQRFLPLPFLTVLASDRNKKSLRSTGKKWLKVTVVAFRQGVKLRDLQPCFLIPVWPGEAWKGQESGRGGPAAYLCRQMLWTLPCLWRRRQLQRCLGKLQYREKRISGPVPSAPSDKMELGGLEESGGTRGLALSAGGPRETGTLLCLSKGNWFSFSVTECVWLLEKPNRFISRFSGSS